jgi:hypothetical protein
VILVDVTDANQVKLFTSITHAAHLWCDVFLVTQDSAEIATDKAPIDKDIPTIRARQ